MDNNKENQIGCVAKRLNISQRTVRYYEELGLISSERSPGGYRIFSQSQIEKLQTILTLKEIGMSLDEIRYFIQLRHNGVSGSESAPELLKFLKRKSADIKTSVEKYNSLLKQLEEVMSIIENCQKCSHLPTDNTCEKCMDDRTHHNVPSLMKTLL